MHKNSTGSSETLSSVDTNFPDAVCTSSPAWKRAIAMWLERLYLFDFAMAAKGGPAWAWARLVRRRKIVRYLKSVSVKKLHLGAGHHCLPEWLNSDLFPLEQECILVDACKPFPFGNDVFDYVYSEHMVEHMAYSDGLRMLRECCRVMRSNGKLRIATPNIGFLLALCNSEQTEQQRRYVQWAVSEMLQENADNDGAPAYGPVFVVNRFVRNWGHRFVYNQAILTDALCAAGFTDVHRCNIRESGDEHLANLENDQRMPPGFYCLETLIMEGTKPASVCQSRQSRS